MRAIGTGMITGALLAPCNVYSGLKIGWTFNMSVAAGLLGFAFWSSASHLFGTRHWALHENNINQTAASASASIISAGLAAPIPALALLTGQTLAFEVLAVWLLVISLLGVVVAAGLRHQLLEREKLPFPSGVVTAETMTEIHSSGAESSARLRLLGLAAAASAALKALVTAFGLGPMAPPLRWTLGLAGNKTLAVSSLNLGFALDPSLLMVGFGAIAGLRIGLSMLIGALAGWAVLAPLALSQGWVSPGPATGLWFGPLVEWLLWPGATLMATSALAGFLMSLVGVVRRRADATRRAQRESSERADATAPRGFDKRLLWLAFVVVLILGVIAQVTIFSIGPFEAMIAVILSYVLAIVAARVSGETAITPIGALGKITQLTFGAISPGQITTNLMTANVTGGAAGQCADLMHDLRTGQIIGATPSFQMIAQIFGILTGSFVAAATYLLLIPSPQTQLLTPQWPAPAVATWKAVAEVLAGGLAAMPPGALVAIAIAAACGIVLAVLEARIPEQYARFVPSGSAIGLGFVIPAWNSLSLLAGAVVAFVLTRAYPDLAPKRVVVVAAGLIVGESLTGVGSALWGFFW
ncbi:OPT family oligopeptide transporter [Rhodopseudomonas sp. BAL398]|nr:OPT family oligopeptide transporter [Rhodopseudomonas sp. BAL398]MDF3810955.1 OPT/YSL family transporter [Rhodopseudomonas sp. BAL398]